MARARNFGFPLRCFHLDSYKIGVTTLAKDLGSALWRQCAVGVLYGQIPHFEIRGAFPSLADVLPPSAVKAMVPVRNRFGLALLVLQILIPMGRVEG